MDMSLAWKMVASVSAYSFLLFFVTGMTHNEGFFGSTLMGLYYAVVNGLIAAAILGVGFLIWMA